MYYSFASLLAFFFCSLGVEANTDDGSVASADYVVMLSLDGFRYDYLDKYEAPNLRKLSAAGLMAKGLIPGFPSTTFPNHYSIVTGLYPGNHGLIGNSFYDTKRRQKYAMKNPKTVTDGSWYRGLPLWQAAQQAGLLSASFFWVGSEAKIQGDYPSAYRKYDGRVKNAQRVQHALDWLNLPIKERPRLITIYFSSVDSAGHRFGPDSEEVRAAVSEVDRQVGTLMKGLEALKLPVNLIVVSDHGMQSVIPEKAIFLAEHIDLEQWRGESKILPGGALSYFYSPDASLVEATEKKLKQVANITVFKRDALPLFTHFAAADPRTPDLVVVAQPGGYIGFRRDRDLARMPAGAHGYLVANNDDMLGVFIAAGPGLKANITAPAFENVHIYPLVLRLLGVPITTQTDGDLSVLAAYLQPSN